MYWCSTKAKIGDTKYMYVEVVDIRCSNFVSFEDYGNTMAKEYRITSFVPNYLTVSTKLFVLI